MEKGEGGGRGEEREAESSWWGKVWEGEVVGGVMAVDILSQPHSQA